MSRLSLVAIALIGTIAPAPASVKQASVETLIEPKVLVVDQSLPNATRDAEILAALRYDTF